MNEGPESNTTSAEILRGIPLRREGYQQVLSYFPKLMTVNGHKIEKLPLKPVPGNHKENIKTLKHWGEGFPNRKSDIKPLKSESGFIAYPRHYNLAKENIAFIGKTDREEKRILSCGFVFKSNVQTPFNEAEDLFVQIEGDDASYLGDINKLEQLSAALAQDLNATPTEPPS